MSIKKTGNFRASKRAMSTLSVPSRDGRAGENRVTTGLIVANLRDRIILRTALSGESFTGTQTKNLVALDLPRGKWILGFYIFNRNRTNFSALNLNFGISETSGVMPTIPNDSNGNIWPGLRLKGDDITELRGTADSFYGYEVTVTSESKTFYLVGDANVTAGDLRVHGEFFADPVASTLSPARIDADNILNATSLGVGSKNITTAAEYSGTPPADNILTAPMLSAGAIVEYGSNADGEYTKYESGLLICTHVRFLNATTTGDKTEVISFPVAFVSLFANPVGWGGASLNDLDNITVYGTKWGGNNPTTNKDNLVVLYRVASTTSFAPRLSYIAIGTWK